MYRFIIRRGNETQDHRQIKITRTAGDKKWKKGNSREKKMKKGEKQKSESNFIEEQQVIRTKQNRASQRNENRKISGKKGINEKTELEGREKKWKINQTKK